MQTPRSTRSSVLGKRSHPTSDDQPSTATSSCDAIDGITLPTPDPSPDPKRPRTSTSILDGDGNKENIPPVVLTVLNRTPSRRVRRSSTETSVSPRRTPRRTVSTSDLLATPITPSTSFSHLALSTPPPTPPSILLPLPVRARALLRPISNGVTGIAGRATERATVDNFFETFLSSLSEEKHTSLYISGSPGTGKTALVNDVLRTRQLELDSHGVKVILINCMALKGVDAIWETLSEALEESPARTRRGRKAKETPGRRVQRLLAEQKSKCIIVLDELDHAASHDQSLLSLFTFVQTFGELLRVVGIANTHTLTSTSTVLSLRSVTSVKTIHFTPYTPQQLLDILSSRLSPLYEDKDSAGRAKKFLPAPALTLLTKKVAAQTGDVRAIFEVLRNAIDIAVEEVKSDDPLAAPAPSVTPANILTALKARSAHASKPVPAAGVPTEQASTSELVVTVRELGLHQRLVLLALLSARKRLEVGLPLSGSSSIPSAAKPSPMKRIQSSFAASSGPVKSAFMDSAQLHSFYSAILARGDSPLFTPVSRSEFTDLLGMLETVGLVSLSSGKASSPGTPSKSRRKGFARSSSFTSAGKGVGQEVRFVEDVRLDEVLRGLGVTAEGVEDELPADVREEEVRAIWERERVRVAREVKAMSRTAEAVDVFEGAMEA